MAASSTFSDDSHIGKPYSPSLRTALTRLDKLMNWERRNRTSLVSSERLMRVSSEPAQQLLESLGNPQKKLKSVIHVTGSKGKGTVSAMISLGIMSLFPKSNVYTYSSPHVERITERLRINGNEIADDILANSLNVSLDHQQNGHTWFDVITSACLLTMSQQQQVDNRGVVEVGMGGRLDSTNVFGGASISLVTNLKLEHVDIIGPTLNDIAYEKAGIINNNTHTAIIGISSNDSLAPIFKKQINSLNKKPNLIFISPHDDDEQNNLFDINLNLAFTALKALIQCEGLQITDEQLLARSGLCHRKELQKKLLKFLPARQEMFCVKSVGKVVNVLLDGGHVPDSVNNVLNEINNDIGVVIVIGVGADKDIKGIVKCIFDHDCVKKIIATQVNDANAYLRADDVGSAFGGDVDVVKDCQKAVVNAVSYAGDHDLQVLVIGSLHLAGRVRPFLRHMHNKI